MVKCFVEFQQNVNQLAVSHEYARHEGMSIFSVTTNILVTKEWQYLALRRAYSSRKNGNIFRYDEYTRHEGMAICCVATSILVTKEWQYFPLQRVYSTFLKHEEKACR